MRAKKDGLGLFVKKYEPAGFQFENEVSWLSSLFIKRCRSFIIPAIKGVDFKNRRIAMDYVAPLDNQITTEKIITIASEIHSVLKSNFAFIKEERFTQERYFTYVRKYFMARVEHISKRGVKIDKKIINFLLFRVRKMQIDYFTIVHRDLYRRNMFRTELGKICLVDWEYANISDPAQDVGKIIYENEIINKNKLKISRINKIISKYYSLVKLRNTLDSFRNRVLFFVFVIAIEDMASGYHDGSEFLDYSNRICKSLVNLYEEM